MNRLFGFYSFQQAIDLSLLERTRFQTLMWTPDHQGHFVDDSVLLTSTQRFITPQCHRALMPYRHAESGCIIIADAFLTQRERLCDALQASSDCADPELILSAYLKWGTSLTRYLSGEFCFAIWEPAAASLLIATDQFSKRPLLYAHHPGYFFTFANELSPFRETCPQLTINENMFASFSLDSLPGDATCYKEVFKILPGHQLQITPRGLQKTCYWQLRDQQKKLPYRTREDYYDAFQSVFQRSVKSMLRTSYPVTAHISGGLDSSSVAAQAAVLLAEEHQPLHALTAVPHGLEGPSYRAGWLYHEMPTVQTLLDRYPTIQHTVYRASPAKDMFHTLRAYYPYVDQPFRNISNIDWILGSYAHARLQGGRVLLTGARGNAGFSRAAYSWKGWLALLVKNMHTLWRPHTAYRGFFKTGNADFLRSKQAKQILRQRAVSFSPHYAMLSATKTALAHTNHYPLSLCHGVLSLDPTHDLSVVEFCYNVPDWVCRDGQGVLANRLLVRRGLAHLLPEAIANNKHRGEQAADWFLHYNEHATSWYAQLEDFNERTKELLSRYYDQQKYANFQQEFPFPLQTPNAQTRMTLDYAFMRYMSAAFFLDYLVR